MSNLIFEATGCSPLIFEAMQALGKNGVLVTADRVNLRFVLGNNVMVGIVNAHREYFEAGVSDLARAQTAWPGWAQHVITHRVAGPQRFGELPDLRTHGRDVINVVGDVGTAA